MWWTTTAFVGSDSKYRWAYGIVVLVRIVAVGRQHGPAAPYAVLLSASTYTEVSETSDHGYPIREHLNRLVDGEII